MSIYWQPWSSTDTSNSELTSQGSFLLSPFLYLFVLFLTVRHLLPIICEVFTYLINPILYNQSLVTSTAPFFMLMPSSPTWGSAPQEQPASYTDILSPPLGLWDPMPLLDLVDTLPQPCLPTLWASPPCPFLLMALDIIVTEGRKGERTWRRGRERRSGNLPNIFFKPWKCIKKKVLKYNTQKQASLSLKYQVSHP